MDSRCISRLELQNFKSVAQCTMELESIVLLVGRNGVGKSNIIDSLRFVTDATRNTLEYAIRERGGIDQVRRKSLGGRPTHPAIALDLRLPDDRLAKYRFRIAAVQGRGFKVDRESCEVFGPDSQREHAFIVEDGQVREWTPKPECPPAAPDRLFLVAASGLPEFRPVYDVLTRMTFHNLNPEVMKSPQRPEPGVLLAHDGRNLASVIKRLESESPAGLERVQHYLRAIGVPITRIQHKQAGALETFEVSMEWAVREGQRNSNFEAFSLSDGTVRAIGILVSLVSAQAGDASGPSLVGIEEPETALHPAAAGALMEGLIEGATKTQLVITCHSPDLLDHEGVTPGMIRPVMLEHGRTVVGRLSPAKAQLLREHLSTAGELLRLDQLEPDPDDLVHRSEASGTLWEGVS